MAQKAPWAPSYKNFSAPARPLVYYSEVASAGVPARAFRVPPPPFAPITPARPPSSCPAVSFPPSRPAPPIGSHNIPYAPPIARAGCAQDLAAAAPAYPRRPPAPGALRALPSSPGPPARPSAAPCAPLRRPLRARRALPIPRGRA